ncbi:MAG: hydrolase [Parcubacteria group bacterium]|nr:hydrolase [Parcubacteria group bacterium]
MPKKLSDEEYQRTLPRKAVGTAVLFFNTKGELLIVKPDYRDDWLVPGGSANENEAPPACAIRETNEEIELDIPALQLVGVDYAHAKGIHSDHIKFLFHGGTLSDEQISSIVLQADEIKELRFLPVEHALPLLSGSMRASIPMSIESFENGIIGYKEGMP